jgi:hypothetical protein
MKPVYTSPPRRVVFINGPPRVGKDTAAAGILLGVPGARVLRLSDPLKNATHAIYGLGCQPDAFEGCKDAPSAKFNGLSPRQAYIRISESAVKPALGLEHLGWVLAQAILVLPPGGVAVVPDSGFTPEAMPILRGYGPENCLLIRVHREGLDFDHDSRSYVYLPGVESLDLHNNNNIDLFKSKVGGMVRRWLDRAPVS